MNPNYERRLSKTLPRVHERIAEATEASGREFHSVCLVAVTKAHSVDAVSAALAAGLTDLGETGWKNSRIRLLSLGAILPPGT